MLKRVIAREHLLGVALLTDIGATEAIPWRFGRGVEGMTVPGGPADHVIAREHFTNFARSTDIAATEAIPWRFGRGVEVYSESPGDCFVVCATEKRPRLAVTLIYILPIGWNS